jgi:hypothetical protein
MRCLWCTYIRARGRLGKLGNLNFASNETLKCRLRSYLSGQSAAFSKMSKLELNLLATEFIAIATRFVKRKLWNYEKWILVNLIYFWKRVLCSALINKNIF